MIGPHVNILSFYVNLSRELPSKGISTTARLRHMSNNQAERLPHNISTRCTNIKFFSAEIFLKKLFSQTPPKNSDSYL